MVDFFDIYRILVGLNKNSRSGVRALTTATLDPGLSGSMILFS